MDYLSIQQCKDALEHTIYRAIACFEKETNAIITEVRVSHIDDACTSVSTRMHQWRVDND